MAVDVAAAPRARAMDAENARWHARSGQLLAVLLRGEETGGRLAAVEVIETRAAPSPRHAHLEHDELVYVLEGEFAFEVDDRRFDAPEGSLVYVPRGVDHGHVATREPARLLVISAPGGIEEEFLAASEPAWSLDPATRRWPPAASAAERGFAPPSERAAAGRSSVPAR